MDGGRLYNLLAVVAATAGFAFAVHASYPGYMNADVVGQLGEAMSWDFYDWHSPTVALLWSLLLKLLPGPAGFLVLDNLLTWGGVVTLAILLRDRFGVWAILFLAIPLLPGTVNFLGNVHVDAMLAAWLIAASSLGYAMHRQEGTARRRVVLRVLANVCIFAAFLTRVNAVFALIPLLLYVNSGLGMRRNLALSTALFVAMPLAVQVQNVLLDVRSMHPVDSVKTYHLLELSYYRNKNQFPGNWTEQQSRDIVESCYSHVQWDSAAPWGSCSFISKGLQAQGLWGSSTLTQAWLGAIIQNPLDLFTMLAPTFRKSMFNPNSRHTLHNEPNPWGWAVADNPPRPSTQLAQSYIRSTFTDRLSRPGLYGVLSVLGILLIFRLRLTASPEGRFAIAILASGLIYLLTFFAINVSAEYRYFYWCGFASFIGLTTVVLAAVTGRRAPDISIASDRMDHLLKRTMLCIAAVATALFVLPADLPKERRVIAVTPVDTRPVIVKGIHSLGTPKWMGRAFEGEIERMTWIRDGNEYRSTEAGSPLVDRLEMLHQTAEVVFATGPGMGEAFVDGPGLHRRISLDADSPGQLSVTMPPVPTRPYSTAQVSITNFSLALVLSCLFFWIYSRSTAGHAHRRA